MTLRKNSCFFLLLLATQLFTACQKEINFGASDYKTLGTSAAGLLQSTTYTSLVVQISYMPGYAPGAVAVDNLAAFLNTYLNKPAGITIIQQQIAASGKGKLSLSEIAEVEKANRSVFTEGNIIALHFLITDGVHNTANTFATSYWNTSSCIFGKAIDDNSGGAGQVSRAQLLSTILEHESGHLMGLVDQGSPMQTNHKDAANGAHCNNSNCLMYYGIETSSNGNPLFIPLPDASCLADLKANGGK